MPIKAHERNKPQVEKKAYIVKIARMLAVEGSTELASIQFSHVQRSGVDSPPSQARPRS